VIRHIHAAVTLGLILLAIPLRAATKPHGGTDRQTKTVWTNDDLDKLHALGLISIAGRERDDKKPTWAPANAPYLKTRDPDWYAAQAAKLRNELEYRQAQLRDYQQALDDARNLGKSTGGIDLVDEDFAITPDAGIAILQQRVNETQSKLDALEDSARRNDIEPGTLRGQ
jgi:hypothetical protein